MQSLKAVLLLSWKFILRWIWCSKFKIQRRSDILEQHYSISWERMSMTKSHVSKGQQRRLLFSEDNLQK